MEETAMPDESPYVISGYDEILALLSETDRAQTLTRLAAGSLLERSIENVGKLVDRLDPLTRSDLAAALELPPQDGPLWEDFGGQEVLIEKGLIIPVMLGDVMHFLIPMEVRVVCFDGHPEELPPPLAVHLYFADDEDLEELADFYQVNHDEVHGQMELALAVADAVLQADTVLRVFSSLSPLARRLLIWLASVPRRVALERMEATAQRLATESAEAIAAVRVLHRLGYVHASPFDASVVMVPVDVMTMLFELLNSDLIGASREAYRALRALVVPAMRDLFPRGAGGNSLDFMRWQLMRALVGLDVNPRAMRLLVLLRIYDIEHDQPGEWASVHLDLSGPDALSRTALRTWIGVMGDDFTQRLMRVFDCDAAAITQGLFEAQHRHGETDPRIGDALAEWGDFLYFLRAHLIMTLGLLPAGHWFRLDALAAWLVGQYRLVRWQQGHAFDFADWIPEEVLPISLVEVGASHVPRMTEALRWVFQELFEPLGALMFEETGALFMTNPESLRVLRDFDPAFEVVWRDADAVMGDDLDMWMPGPTELGVRVSGVVKPTWSIGPSVAIMKQSHISDLIRLCQWADPVQQVNTFGFMFTEESVHRGESLGADAEEMLVWLRTRTERDVPGWVRSLFHVSTSATDHDAETTARKAATYVDALLAQIESWGSAPYTVLIEELRGWGSAAAVALTRLAEEGVAAAAWDDPMMRHVALLLGALGVEEATPSVLRMLAFSSDSPLELASAMACGRIGPPALDGLISLLNNTSADVNKRLAACGTLATLAILHPPHCERVVRELGHFIRAERGEGETATIAAMSLVETGHASAEKLLYELKEEGGWEDRIMPFDEALWITGISPSTWGPPTVAAPLAAIYLTASESAALERQASLGDVMSEAGVRSESILGNGKSRWRKWAQHKANETVMQTPAPSHARFWAMGRGEVSRSQGEASHPGGDNS